MSEIPVDDIFADGHPSMLSLLQQGELLLTLAMNFDGVVSGEDVQRLDEARGGADEAQRLEIIKRVVEGIGIRVSNARQSQSAPQSGRRNIKF